MLDDGQPSTWGERFATKIMLADQDLTRAAWLLRRSLGLPPPGG
jgi:hypothetical protein